MSIDLRSFLNHKAINAWPLFWWVTGPISIAMIIAMLRTDLATGPGVSSMIQLSVRCAVPWLYLAFAASASVVLFPGAFSRWLLRNRKYLGLCFAAAMAWQALFIIWLVTVHRDYYLAEVYVLRDVLEGLLGYSFLVAMTLTSFPFGRRWLTARQWKVLHKLGIYSLWIYAFSVYWWELFYYPGPEPIDYLYYWAGFGAWGLRAAAWRKKRRQRTARRHPGRSVPLIHRVLGASLVGVGLLAVTFGTAWRQAMEALLVGIAWSDWLVLYLPYWPFEPYIPLFVILLGAWFTARTRALPAPVAA